jgi:hypothetical protein
MTTAGNLVVTSQNTHLAQAAVSGALTRVNGPHKQPDRNSNLLKRISSSTLKPSYAAAQFPSAGIGIVWATPHHHRDAAMQDSSTIPLHCAAQLENMHLCEHHPVTEMCMR